MNRARRAVLMSIGFGLENIDCPDLNMLSASPVTRHSTNLLSHNRCQSAELKHVSCHEQQRVKYLFFFTPRSTFGKNKDQEGQSTKESED